MNSQIKAIVDPTLLNSLFELAKDDIVLQQVIKRTDTLSNFVNSLIAAIVCINNREVESQKTLVQLLESNPQVKQLLEIKNDPSLLSKKIPGS
jgi:hypothetical protein